MLKYAMLKSPLSWELKSLQKVDTNSEMTIVSEYDFKMRYLYPELEALFFRSFETELLDNFDSI